MAASKKKWIVIRESRLLKYAYIKNPGSNELRQVYEGIIVLQKEKLLCLLVLIVTILGVVFCTVAGIFLPEGLRELFIALDAGVLIYFGWKLSYCMFLNSHLQLWYLIYELMENNRQIEINNRSHA